MGYLIDFDTVTSGERKRALIDRFLDRLFNILHMHPTKISTQIWITGGRLNKKDGLTRYGNSHVKDKTS